MPAALNTHVNQAIQSGSDVFVHAAPEAIRDGLCLDLNGTQIGLSPLAHPDRDLPPAPFHADFAPSASSVPVEVHTQDGARLNTITDAPVNQLPDWAVAGGRTIQIQIAHEDTQHFISLSPAVTVPADAGALRFKALLAAHRCTARLLVQVAPLDGSHPTTLEDAFTPDRMGGISAGGYLSVDMALPDPHPSGVRVSVHMAYQGCTLPLPGHQPYLFLANPWLEAAQDRSRANAPISTQVGTAKAANWYHARLPIEGGTTALPLALRLGEDTQELAPTYTAS